MAALVIRPKRSSIRPVLKHGPRSLARARAKGKTPKPVGVSESENGGTSLSGEAHSAGTSRCTESDRAGTRKMVNYSRSGRSRRKLRWKSVAILTCKSVV